MLGAMLVCDLTQSWAKTGGGISTYIREKRNWIEKNSNHRHLLIVPGPKDAVFQSGRHITVEIKSPKVPGSPEYRLLLRSKAVIAALDQFQPDIVECLDVYNLPWAAISWRKRHPYAKLIAGYRTDFAKAYAESMAKPVVGIKLAKKVRHLAYRYMARLYNNFDLVYSLNKRADHRLQKLGIAQRKVLPLGVRLDQFHPDKRSDKWRQQLNGKSDGPILVYAGRIDGEKGVPLLIDAFEKLPEQLGARLVLLGEGGLREKLQNLARAKGLDIYFPGYEADRNMLATALASSDLYVSAMPFETFGISVIEAQACGLPVVGVEAGAMTDRVKPDTGVLGPVGNSDAMARNIEFILTSGQAGSMGLAARKHVKARYSWQKSFNTLFENIYADALAS